MKLLTGMTALLLFAAPALAGDVPQDALTSLGLTEMQSMTDAEGMDVRGKESSFAMVIGTSLVFGQLIDPNTKNFVVGSDVNMVSANSQSTAFHTASTAGKHHSSSISLALTTQEGNILALQGIAGGSGIAVGGFGNILGYLNLP